MFLNVWCMYVKVTYHLGSSSSTEGKHIGTGDHARARGLHSRFDVIHILLVSHSHLLG